MLASKALTDAPMSELTTLAATGARASPIAKMKAAAGSSRPPLFASDFGVFRLAPTSQRDLRHSEVDERRPEKKVTAIPPARPSGAVVDAASRAGELATSEHGNSFF